MSDKTNFYTLRMLIRNALLFAAGVIIAHLAGANQLAVDALAASFLVLRVLHGILYIRDQATLRSMAWTLGFLVTIGLFLAAGWADS